MTFIVADRVQETTNSPGTGTATLLGAVSGYQSFSTGIGANNTTYYVIADQLGTNWEVGLGALNSTGTQLTRTTVYSSSNGGSTVNFATGLQYVWCDYPSSKAVTQGNPVNFSSIGATTSGTGAFTTLSASSTVSGAGFSNYFAAPPTIGNTTPNAGNFTTLSASSTVNGTGFSNYFAAPPTIGNTTPNTGNFTTLSADSLNLTNGIAATKVTYNEGGTGAVDTTVAAKLQETISVLDFGADPTGVTDSSTAITNAINSAINSTPNIAQEIYFPPGQYLCNSQINVTLPDSTGTQYLYNGLILKGAGQQSTKLIAGASNTNGIFYIQVQHLKSRVEIQDMQFVSTINANGNTGQNNGTAIWIGFINGTPTNPFQSENTNRPQVYINNVLIASDSTSEGLAINQQGVWAYGIYLQRLKLPTIQNTTIASPMDSTYTAFNYTGNMIDAIHMDNCYVPMFLNCSIAGLWQTGVNHTRQATVAGTQGRPEGGYFTNSSIGGCVDGITINMNYTTEPVNHPDVFQILGSYIYARRYGININQYEQVLISDNILWPAGEAWVGTTGYPSTATNLTACVFVNDSSDIKVQDNYIGYAGAGYYTSTTNAATGVYLYGQTYSVTIDNNTFNHAGISIYCLTETHTGTNTAVTNRSIYSTGCAWTGDRIVNTPQTNIKAYDPNNVLIITYLAFNGVGWTGTGYAVGDSVTAKNIDAIGGTGSGFSVLVSSIHTPDGSITGFGAITPGSGYTNGQYNSAFLGSITGTGEGAQANITIAGGVVTAVTPVGGTGANYYNLVDYGDYDVTSPIFRTLRRPTEYASALTNFPLGGLVNAGLNKNGAELVYSKISSTLESNALGAENVTLGFGTYSNGALKSYININGTKDAVVFVNSPVILPIFTLSTLPAASSYVAGIAYVSNGASNKKLVVSDSTNWRYPDGTIAV